MNLHVIAELLSLRAPHPRPPPPTPPRRAAARPARKGGKKQGRDPSITLRRTPSRSRWRLPAPGDSALRLQRAHGRVGAAPPPSDPDPRRQWSAPPSTAADG